LTIRIQSASICVHPRLRLFPTALFSKLILVVIVVQSLFFDDVEFDWIEADNFQMHAALFAIDKLAFIRFDVDMDIAFTFGTRSGRHF
jgi:hypothetical protein